MAKHDLQFFLNRIAWGVIDRRRISKTSTICRTGVHLTLPSHSLYQLLVASQQVAVASLISLPFHISTFAHTPFLFFLTSVILLPEAHEYAHKNHTDPRLQHSTSWLEGKVIRRAGP